MSVIHSKLLPFLAIDALMTQLISGQALPTMRAIFGIGEHDLWAVGDLGIIAHIRR